MQPPRGVHVRIVSSFEFVQVIWLDRVMLSLRCTEPHSRCTEPQMAAMSKELREEFRGTGVAAWPAATERLTDGATQTQPGQSLSKIIPNNALVHPPGRGIEPAVAASR